MSRVAVGGTFDPLHDGHIALLKKAIELSGGGELVIGLASDEMASHKLHEVEPFQSRYDKLMRFVQGQKVAFSIVKLDDPFGPAVYDDFDFLVVSPDTYPTALKINMIRKNNGMKQLKVVCFDYVAAEDGLPISSTRIRQGEIDLHGKVLKKS